MNIIFKISPVIFAVAGLLFFIFGQFLKPKNKMICSITGLLLIGLFFYKLMIFRDESALYLSYADRNQYFHISIFQIFMLAVGINILALVLWLFAFLKVAFEKSILSQSQLTILLAGGLVMITSLIIYILFGGIIGGICFPLLAIGFFIAYKMQYSKLRIQ